MKYLILIALPLILIVSCSPYNPKRYKQYSGIDYGVYEQSYSYTEISDLQDDTEQEDITPSEVTEVTEEEIIESSNQAYGEAVVVMANKKFTLGKNATDQDLAIFQMSLDNSYNVILKSYRTEGFTYTLAPAGTVNPLSTINVQCLLSENFANAQGKKVCDAFFVQIPIEYENEKMKQVQE